MTLTPNPETIVVVTGASSGIGEAFARALAARGFDLALVARRRERLDAIASERTAHGIRAEVIVCDVSDRAAREQAYKQIATTELDVDVLINCAGYGMSGAFHRQEPTAVTAMIRTNLEATAEFTATYLPGMVARDHGGVLFVSSVAGMYPNPGMAAYGATTAAMLSLAEAIHGELQPTNVAVCALCPPAVDTAFSKVAGVEDAINAQPSFMIQSAAACAQVGLDAFDQGHRVTFRVL